MFAPSISRISGINAKCTSVSADQLRKSSRAPRFNSESLRERGPSTPKMLSTALRPRAISTTKQRDPENIRGFTLPKLRVRMSAFTLLELLIVMGIIALLLVLIAPAFTYIKGGNDVTSAAYTVKGVLDTARTYAKANNTYAWVGFYEEDVSQPSIIHGADPCTGCVGRVVMSIVASSDGTNIATTNPIDPTKLFQVGKLTKIDNLHLATFTDGSGTGSTFDTRPPVTFNGTQYSLAGMASSTTPFQFPVGNPAPPAQYTFLKAVQFSPSGDARLNNNINSPQTAAEVAFEPTHGAVVPVPVPANVVAVQFTGLGGAVKIYQR